MLPSLHLLGVLNLKIILQKLILIGKLMRTILQEGGAKTHHKKMMPNQLGEILLLEMMHGETQQ
jgi:hypothetical protein